MKFSIVKTSFVVTLSAIIFESVVLIALQHYKEETIEEISDQERDQYTHVALVLASNIFTNQAQIASAAPFHEEGDLAHNYALTAPAFMYSNGIKLVFAAANNLPLGDIILAQFIRYGDDLDGSDFSDDFTAGMEQILDRTLDMLDATAENARVRKTAAFELGEIFAQSNRKALDNIFERSNLIRGLEAKKDNLSFWMLVTVFLAVSFQILTVTFVFSRDLRER